MKVQAKSFDQVLHSACESELVTEFYECMKSLAAKVDVSLIDLSWLPNGIICGPQYGHEELLG